MTSKVATVLVGIVLLGAAACGNDEQGPAEKNAPTSSAATSPATEAPAAESEISEDCELAVRNWATAAHKQVADIAFGAPDNAGDPAVLKHANEISSYCPADLSVEVADVNVRLALGEAQLTAGKKPDEDAATLTADITAITDSLT